MILTFEFQFEYGGEKLFTDGEDESKGGKDGDESKYSPRIRVMNLHIHSPYFWY